jgi:hypothetical protein
VDAAGLVPLSFVTSDMLQAIAPPPQAFFLTEQLLRATPSVLTLNLALQLLSCNMDWAMQAGEQQQQQQQGTQGGSTVGMTADQQAASAEVRRLAYCSLASSVVQIAVRDPQLAVEWEPVMQLAQDLYSALLKEAALSSAISSSSSSSHNSMSGESSSNSEMPLTKWTLLATLSATAAAGAYTAHLGSVVVPGDTPGQAVSCSSGSSSSRLESVEDPGTSTLSTDTSSHSSDSRHPAGHNSSGHTTAGSSGATTGAAVGTAAAGEVGGTSHPEDCMMCCAAGVHLIALRCFERGTAMPGAALSANPAVYAEAAKRRGINLQQYLQEQLLALAWQHPVSYVCGNVRCGRLEGLSAVAAVRGPTGTLCGGCRAAWYCCKECQRAAWEAHMEVCGGSTGLCS